MINKNEDLSILIIIDIMADYITYIINTHVVTDAPVRDTTPVVFDDECEKAPVHVADI